MPDLLEKKIKQFIGKWKLSYEKFRLSELNIKEETQEEKRRRLLQEQMKKLEKNLKAYLMYYDQN